MFVRMPPPYGRYPTKENSTQDRILSNYLKVIVSLVVLVGVLVTMITNNIFTSISEIKTDVKSLAEKQIMERADVAIIKSDVITLQDNTSKRADKEDKMFARYGLKMEEDQFSPRGQFRFLK